MYEDNNNMGPSGIYPNIKNQENENINEYLIQDLKTKLANLRLVDFESDLMYLDEKIKHYNKIYTRWKNFDSGIRYTDILIGTLIGGTSAILIALVSLGFLIPIIVTTVITTIPLGYSVIQGILAKGLIKSRKKKYNELILKITEVRNKLFLYHQKALEDNILTNEEIQTSKNMVKGIKDLIKNINVQEIENDDKILKELEALKNKISHKKK